MAVNNKFKLTAQYLNQVAGCALDEDAGRGDITSEILIPRGLQCSAYIQAKEIGIIAGEVVASRVFKLTDRRLHLEVLIKDGTPVKHGDRTMTISGSARSILKAERVALNFLQRLSGIASLTAQYVAKTKDLGVPVVDTRKTTPGLRLLEKYAVRMGGGGNHRLDLSDAILIKDNHFAALHTLGVSYSEVVARAKKEAPGGIKVEAEAKTVEEALAAVEAGADIVMLDNMSLEEMRRAVSFIKGKVRIEASGGVNINTVRSIAETGVDFISVGAFTHSPKALDISLEIEPESFKLA